MKRVVSGHFESVIVGGREANEQTGRHTDRHKASRHAGMQAYIICPCRQAVICAVKHRSSQTGKQAGSQVSSHACRQTCKHIFK